MAKVGKRRAGGGGTAVGWHMSPLLLPLCVGFDTLWPVAARLTGGVKIPGMINSPLVLPGVAGV